MTAMQGPDGRCTACDGRSARAGMRVRLDVYCGTCRQLIGTYHGEINEKYPFDCEDCGQTEGKWPWKIIATIVADGSQPAPTS